MNGISTLDFPNFQRLDPNERNELHLLHHRVATLEKINTDLEKRLEDQARLTMKAEKMYTDLNQSWTERNALLKKEIEEWKDKYNKQVKITDRKVEKLTRTERELYGLLQRKYELMGDRRNANNDDGSAALKPQPPSLPPSTSQEDLQSLSPDTQRRRFLTSLSEFLGM